MASSQRYPQGIRRPDVATDSFAALFHGRQSLAGQRIQADEPIETGTLTARMHRVSTGSCAGYPHTAAYASGHFVPTLPRISPVSGAMT
uniref:Uncharacterized protein n=1 Tax=Burkholderia orbicola (strain AU 1054) TaxID=331271 RepID=A0A0H2XL26_BURO1